MNDEKLPFALHLEELRGRLLLCLFVISILSLTSFVIWPKIISLMWINDISMIYISPQEAFLTRIKVSSICGLLGSIPVILHQIWKFIKPALTERERKLIISLGIVSTVLLFAGIYFNVFIVTPIVVNFFLRSSQPTLTPLISISNYTSFFYLSEDKHEGVLFMYRVLSTPNRPLYRVRLDGLRPDLMYEVEGYDQAISGAQLMQYGINEPEEFKWGDFKGKMI